MGQSFASPSGAATQPATASARSSAVQHSGVASSQDIDTLLRINKEMYEKGATYTKLIVGLGYAGFFTAWSGAHALFTPFMRVSSALLVTFSLLVFVAFEIFEMLQRGMLLRDFHKAVSSTPEKLKDALLKYSAIENRTISRSMRVWVVSLWLTIVPGGLGGLVLVFAFAQRVWTLR